jgi:hypothetical protein
MWKAELCERIRMRKQITVDEHGLDYWNTVTATMAPTITTVAEQNATYLFVASWRTTISV